MNRHTIRGSWYRRKNFYSWKRANQNYKCYQKYHQLCIMNGRPCGTSLLDLPWILDFDCSRWWYTIQKVTLRSEICCYRYGGNMSQSACCKWDFPTYRFNNLKIIMNVTITTATHKILRGIFYILGGILAIWTFIPAISVGQWFSDAESAFPYEINSANQPVGTNETTNLADIVKTDTVNSTTSVLKRLTDFFRLSGTSYDTWTSKATNYVKWILNILLGLVSFLSLVMIIFAFYLIFFSKGEDGVAKAKKILIGVGIALAIMWLSWFIASFFFDIYTTVT